jgi:hypothetical protein
MLGWDRYGFDKKCVKTHYAKLVFLHPVGSVGHVEHSHVFGPRNGDALFFMLGWDQYRFNINVPGHVTLNLCYCIRCNTRVT